MNAILSSIIPVASIVLLGVVAGKTLKLELATLSRLVLYVLSPALIADSLYRTEVSAENAAGMVIGCIATFFMLGLIAWILGKKKGLPEPLQKSFVTTTVFPNAGFMGLPITLFALEELGLQRAVIYMLAHSIISFTTLPAFLKGGGFWNRVAFTLKLPIIWGMFLGFGLRLLPGSPGSLPFKLDTSLHMLAQANICIGLLILGMQISNSRFELKAFEGGSSLMRLAAGGIVAYWIGRALGFQTLDLQVLILQSSMPAGISSFLMVNEFGGDGARTAGVVVISTLLSFLTLPVVLWAISMV
ncbi:MAG: AEC family transporter [Oscillatoria sp. SIO1A7]|nr:AEC family transporter [Oscillatoria sp. SIO1A7]